MGIWSSSVGLAPILGFGLGKFMPPPSSEFNPWFPKGSSGKPEFKLALQSKNKIYLGSQSQCARNDMDWRRPCPFSFHMHTDMLAGFLIHSNIIVNFLSICISYSLYANQEIAIALSRWYVESLFVRLLEDDRPMFVEYWHNQYCSPLMMWLHGLVSPVLRVCLWVSLLEIQLPVLQTIRLLRPKYKKI